MRTCQNCLKTKDDSEFYSAKSLTFCKTCYSDKNRKYYEENKEKLNAKSSERIKFSRRKTKRVLVEEAGGRCMECGYDRFIGALQFHHRDPNNKLFNIGDGWVLSINILREEIKKCDLLCANCHAEKEWMEEHEK